MLLLLKVKDPHNRLEKKKRNLMLSYLVDELKCWKEFINYLEIIWRRDV